MIKFERTSVMNLENAIRGARNPMNSWGRMDSAYDEDGNYILGPNDLIWQSGSAGPAATIENTSARSLSPWTSPPPCTGGRNTTPTR